MQLKHQPPPTTSAATTIDRRMVHSLSVSFCLLCVSISLPLAQLDKYRLFHFGRCPRVLCRGQAVLPIGLSDTPNEDSVKLYCPRCEEIYGTKSPRHEHIDGAYFGTTFAHLFYLTFPELKVSKSKEYYIPRVFGFKIHKSAYKRSLEMRKREKEREKERRKREQQQGQTGQQQPALPNEQGTAAAGQAAG